MSNEEQVVDIDFQTMTHDDTPSPQLSATPGARLKQARLDRGLNEADVADQLRLPKSAILSIEADAYDKLPNFTFIRGYLRSYARFMELSGDDLVKQFDALGLEEEKPQPKANRTPMRHVHMNDKAIRWITYGVALVLVALLLIWWHNHSNTASEDISTTPSGINQPQALQGAPLPLMSSPPMTAEQQQQAHKKLKELAPNFGAMSKKKAPVKTHTADPAAGDQDH